MKSILRYLKLSLVGLLVLIVFYGTILATVYVEKITGEKGSGVIVIILEVVIIIGIAGWSIPVIQK